MGHIPLFGPVSPRAILLCHVATVFNNRPLEHVSRSWPIFVTMYPDYSTRLECYHPEPELQPGDFRTKVDCGERSEGNILVLSRRGLLCSANLHGKRKSQEHCNNR